MTQLPLPPAERQARLTELMQAHCLSPCHVADLLLVSTSTVYGWLNGSANVPLRSIDHLEAKLALRGDNVR